MIKNGLKFKNKMKQFLRFLAKGIFVASFDLLTPKLTILCSCLTDHLCEFASK